LITGGVRRDCDPREPETGNQRIEILEIITDPFLPSLLSLRRFLLLSESRARAGVAKEEVDARPTATSQPHGLFQQGTVRWAATGDYEY